MKPKTSLTVAEYMPPALLWLERIGKLVLIALCAVVVVVFWRRMDSLLEQRQQYVEYEERFTAYEAYMERGQSAMEESSFEEAEQCYRSAMMLLPGAEAPYLELSQVFRQVREYEAALEILREYQGQESEDIQAAITDLQELTEVLGQSVLHP